MQGSARKAAREAEKARLQAALEEARAHGTPYDLELEIVTARGEHKWVRTICRPIVENGKVTRLRTPKVPHIGWNDIEWGASGNGEKRSNLGTAYFANAYICQPEDEAPVLAWTAHQDTRFASIVRSANTVGVQFHPEKSSYAGRTFVNAVIEDLIECR